jgi:hypothetical protein
MATNAKRTTGYRGNLEKLGKDANAGAKPLVELLFSRISGSARFLDRPLKLVGRMKPLLQFGRGFATYRKDLGARPC